MRQPTYGLSASQLPIGWQVIPQGSKFIAVNESARLCTAACLSEADAILQANRYLAKPRQHPATPCTGVCVIREDGVRFTLIA